jgi:hypothetical protein
MIGCPSPADLEALPLDLDEALVERVVAAGGSVDLVEEPWLGRVEGGRALPNLV